MKSQGRVGWVSTRLFMFACLFSLVVTLGAQTRLVAQDGQAGPSTENVEQAQPADADSTPVVKPKSINFFSLVLRGGWFMVPLGILSLVVVALSIERFISLRKEKIMPAELITHLGNLGHSQSGFDPARHTGLPSSIPQVLLRY